MRKSSTPLIVLFMLVLQACSGSPADSYEAMDPADFTVSYREAVDVPKFSRILSGPEFVSQVKTTDPIHETRCPLVNEDSLEIAADELGGFRWKNPVPIILDRSLPLLYENAWDPSKDMPIPLADGASETVQIERPDLVGLQNDKALFLSERLGLLYVDTSGESPRVSCSLELPGRPLSFFYKNSEVIVLVNSIRPYDEEQSGAVLRFRLDENGFSFVDHVLMTGESILDARTFNNTVILYSEGRANPTQETTPLAKTAMSAGDVSPVSNLRSHVKLSAIEWTDNLTLDWEEMFLEDNFNEGPLVNQDPASFQEGDLVRTYRRYANFLSASDEYLVVKRGVRNTYHDGVETRTYSVCTDYNPQHHQVRKCSPIWERQPNPDYREADTLDSDYSCGGQTLLSCIDEVAPTVSRYIYRRAGQECRSVWRGKCMASEQRTIEYPTFRSESVTGMVVYRYVDGEFIKLDDQLYELAPPNGDQPESLGFDPKPLEVAGHVNHRNQMQFQRGHFYVVAGDQQTVHTMRIVGNSIAYLRGTNISTDHDPTVLFTSDRLMTSSTFYKYGDDRGINFWSKVNMLDLSVPEFPSLIQSFEMPGTSSQLLLANSGILGPGVVDFTSGGVHRNLTKITLFDRENADELDNLLLGTELNSHLVTSHLMNDTDDQKIRLHPETQRLFTPYSGTHHDSEMETRRRHLLNITQVNMASLQSEATFDMEEPIIRTVSIADHEALAFGTLTASHLYLVGSEWKRDLLQRVFVPIGIYRLNDENTYVEVSRMGENCRARIFQGKEKAFEKEAQSTSETILCHGSPIGVGAHIVFQGDKTGWSFDATNGTIETLTSEEAEALLEKIKHDVYCFLNPEEVGPRTPVRELSTVPEKIHCDMEPSWDSLEAEGPITEMY